METSRQEAQSRYAAVAIALHWTIAVLILGLIWLGWTMTKLHPGDADRVGFYQLHKSLGITVLLLSLSRVVWRLMNPPPPEPPMPRAQALAAAIVHAGFYVLIFAMPLTGWAMASASPQGTPTVLYGLVRWPHLPGLSGLDLAAKRELHEPLEFVHSKLAWVMIVLLGLHVAGALKHQFVNRDGLLARIAPGVFGRTLGPPAKTRGYLAAFGTLAAALVLGIAAASFGDTQSPPKTELAAGPGAGSAPTESTAPAWNIDAAKSSIAFKGVYSGRAFAGKFAGWTARIQFDPEKPEIARIHVEVPTSSAATGESYFDDSLKEGDWFDAGNFPKAIFEVNEDGGVTRISGDQYEATGVFTVKGQVFPLRLPFTLKFDGDTATMHAEKTMKRLELKIGAGTTAKETKDEEWVSDDIGVTIHVVATRQR